MIVETIYGKIENVPIIRWMEFEPYWISIVTSFAEVITENKFHPYPANNGQLDGFVLTYKYWSKFKSEVSFPFKQALFFLYKLKEKPQFYEAIKEFNKSYKNDWLSTSNLPLLGNRVYGFYHILKPIFITKFEEYDEWLAIKYINSKPD